MRLLAIALASACFHSPATPPAPPPPPPDRVTHACDRLIAANRRVDAAARRDHTDSAGLRDAWPGTCVRIADVGWGVVLDEAHYGAVHDVTCTLVHISASGTMVRAAEPMRFNFGSFELQPGQDGQSVVVDLVSEGPETDHEDRTSFTWDGVSIRQIGESVVPPE